MRQSKSCLASSSSSSAEDKEPETRRGRLAEVINPILPCAHSSAQHRPTLSSGHARLRTADQDAGKKNQDAAHHDLDR